MINSLHRSYQILIVFSHYWTNSLKIICWIKNDIYVFNFLFAVLQEKLMFTTNAFGSQEIPESSVHPFIIGWLLREMIPHFTCTGAVVMAVVFSANSEIQILSWTCSTLVNHQKRWWLSDVQCFTKPSSTLQISRPFARMNLISSCCLLFLTFKWHTCFT